MTDITSPTDNDSSSAADPHTLAINSVPTKKKGGRPRKEDAAQKEQELSSEAKAKRDKRRHDNLLAAARYRQKKDEAIKLLTQQLQAREYEVNEKYAKIMEFKNRIEQMESFRQDFSEQLAELKTKWDNELSAIVDATQAQQSSKTPNAATTTPTTPARGVLIMPVMRNISTSQAHTYTLPTNTIAAHFNESTDIPPSGIRTLQSIRQIGIGTTTISPSTQRMLDPSTMKRLPKHLPAEYFQAAIHRGIDAPRQPTPPTIDGFARSVVALPVLRETMHSTAARATAHPMEETPLKRQTNTKLGDIQPPMGQLRLPIVRSNSPINNNASSDDGVFSFLRLDQPNPYSLKDPMVMSPSSAKEQPRIRTFAHRKGRPRLDEAHSGQVLTATNCEPEKCSPSITRYQQQTNFIPTEKSLAVLSIQKYEDNNGVLQQTTVGKHPMRSSLSKVVNH